MRLLKILSCLLILLGSLQIGFGQEFNENENWIGAIEGGVPPFLIHNLNKYSKEDVVRAKEKLNLIKQSPTGDEWEGSYSLPGDLRDTKLFWNSKFGFVNYYVYTCAIELRALNYGRAVNNPDSVILMTEKNRPPFYRADKSGQSKLIKVKWGDLRYLVEEDALETFCELAAGYYGAAKNETTEVDGESFASQTTIENSFWVKNEDLRNKKTFGLPILPKPYEKFIKQPIETEIISIGKYEKDPPTDRPIATYSRRYVNIGAGKNSGIKIDMEFYVPALGERIRIVKVLNNTAVGVLERWIDSETRQESCSGETEDAPCRLPKAGMKIKTLPDEFLQDD